MDSETFEAPTAANDGAVPPSLLAPPSAPGTSFLSTRRLGPQPELAEDYDALRSPAAGKAMSSFAQDHIVQELSRKPASGRKAKSSAMSSLNTESLVEPSETANTSITTGTDIDPSLPHPSRNPARRVLPRARPLDFSAIRTSAPSRLPPRSNARAFGLEHCPIFYPSVEEFANPLEYIQSVANQSRARHFGMCKVIPPEGWKPPFAHDTETFRFTTRLQRLNSMEATARANINLMEQLYLFHKQQRNSKVTVPTVGSKPVDLWRLRKEVNILGGFDKVSENRKWTQVGKTLGYDVKKAPGIPAQLKTAFLKIVQPFEEYRAKVLVSSSPSQASPSLARGMRSTPPNLADSVRSKSLSPDGSPVTMAKVHAASERLNSALNASPAPSASNPGRPTSQLEPPVPEEWVPGDACEICRGDHDEKNILLCDDCDRGYHLGCLDPPLTAVPRGNWICDACIVTTGADYGFEEGDEHSFYSFHRLATAFRKRWLAEHPAPEGNTALPTGAGAGTDWRRELAIEDHVERNFWKLVENASEDVEVEYGADLHTSKCGSAIPTLETHPNEPYARDGWNLNNLPILHGSLLRYVKSDICGMTVPWGYVGMMFSTFAWHKEDHYTYSVNYHHWGGTKTWYAVPAEDDDKLESAIKAAAPELFQQQPDLMFQLVTLMSPGRLKKAGVRVSACDQRPNEFVITFPKAYHAGFNHCMNYNEAVNFCLPDWLKEDLACVKKYRTVNKAPVFSHDELLVTIFTHEKSQEVARWLLPNFEEMVAREMEARATARRTIEGLVEVTEDEEHLDEYYQCKVDRSYRFLSQITAKSAGFVTCPEHHSELGSSKIVMKNRYTDQRLLDMMDELKARAAGQSEPIPTHGARKRELSVEDGNPAVKVPRIEKIVAPPLPPPAMIIPA